MLSEFILLSINVTLFDFCIFEMFYGDEVIVHKRRIFRLLLFLTTTMLFLLGIILSSYSPIIFFQVKTMIFSLVSFIFSASLLIFVIYRKIENIILKIFSVFIFSTLLFFLFFGLETWSFFGINLNSFSLLKSQNPLIATACTLILFIPKKKLKIISLASFIFLFILTSLFLKKSCEKAKNITFMDYIPYEIFLSGDYCLLEEKDGLYIEIPLNGKEEIFYKFSIPEKLTASQVRYSFFKKVISRTQFPVIFTSDEAIAIFDLKKKFFGETQKIIFDQNLNPVSVDGPLF